MGQHRHGLAIKHCPGAIAEYPPPPPPHLSAAIDGIPLEKSARDMFGGMFLTTPLLGRPFRDVLVPMLLVIMHMAVS